MFCLLVFGGGRRTCLEEEEEDEENASTNHVPRSSPHQHERWVFRRAEGHVGQLGPPRDLLDAEGLVPVCCCCCWFFFSKKGFLGCGMYEGGLRVMY